MSPFGALPRRPTLRNRPLSIDLYAGGCPKGGVRSDMSFLMRCPNCGERSVYEFRFGGETRPPSEGEIPDAHWGDHLYARRNEAGVQQEWWFHRAGCRKWFQAVRNT